MNRLIVRAISGLIIATLLMIGISSAATGGTEPVGFGRYPAPSPDGKTLAFSWAGSIWTVPIRGGLATRLTSSDGYDYLPIWSPTGDRIAFSSNRYGSDDLFVIGADGGTPERITFASNGDLLSGWMPRGDGLIFSSRRGGVWPDNRAPHTVFFDDKRGSGPAAPRLAVTCPGLGAVIDHNAHRIAFEVGPGNGFRQTYEGTHKKDIWIYDTVTDGFTRVTDNSFGNSDPGWSADGNTLYFRSEQDGIGNLWAQNQLTKETYQVTHLKDVSMWNPRVGGKKGEEIVAFEWKGGIYIQNISGGRPNEIDIEAWLGEDPHKEISISASSGASEYSISPDGEEMAFVYRGEIYCVRADGVGGTDAARLTNHAARDFEISWYPRGDAILFTSDRTGTEQLYKLMSDDPDHERLSESRRFRIERITKTDESCQSAVMAPPGEGDDALLPENQTIAYTRDHLEFWLMDGEGKNDRKIFSYWGTDSYSFSPDGRWLVLSRDDEDYNIDIMIMAVDPDDPDLSECPTDGWEPFPGKHVPSKYEPSWKNGWVNITRHPDDDYMPIWSPDGSKIGFSSQRNWDNLDAYFVFLKEEDEQRSYAEWDLADDPLKALPALPEEEEEEVEEEEPAEEETEEEEDVDEEKFIVEIDFDGIHRRSHRLTRLDGSEFLYGFSPDGENLLYTSTTGGSNTLWQMSWRGTDKKQIATSPSNIEWHIGDKRIYYMSAGRVKSMKQGGGDSKTHNFMAEFSADPVLERKYVFNEVWRFQNRWFYDPDFHGRDWDALRVEYEPIVMSARHYRDFDSSVDMMLGRLNSSHLSFSAAGSYPSGPDTGYLGCGFVEDGKQGLLIEWITPDTPIARIDHDIEVGDRIVSINGTNVAGWGDHPIGNYWRAFEGTYNNEIEIVLIDRDDPSEPRYVRINPTNYMGWLQAEYENWVDRNQETVNDISGGRLGYLHIQRMYDGPLERFEQDLYTIGHGKDGLIIDVRYNSGGWITDWLVSMLSPLRHALTQPRDGGLGYPEDRTPVFTTDIPIVVLCNEYSFSNAEIFTHAMQRLDRGTVVGWPTAGGVISTGGVRFTDGSYLSQPRRGWWAFDPKTEKRLFNLEGTPATPEVLVPFLPVNFQMETDPQLDAAIATLLAEVG